MSCVGDGWHKVIDCMVYVEDRVITDCLMQDASGRWTPHRILRWNPDVKRYMCVGKLTLSAFRSGVKRGTIVIG